MKFDFNISNNISGYAEILRNGIFHIRIAPLDCADKISALDKYGYLEKLPADENAGVEQNDDILKIKTAEAVLLIDKKSGCFELTDKNGKTLLKQKTLTFSSKKVNASFAISEDDKTIGTLIKRINKIAQNPLYKSGIYFDTTSGKLELSQKPTDISKQSPYDIYKAWYQVKKEQSEESALGMLSTAWKKIQMNLN